MNSCILSPVPQLPGLPRPGHTRNAPPHQTPATVQEQSKEAAEAAAAAADQQQRQGTALSSSQIFTGLNPFRTIFFANIKYGCI